MPKRITLKNREQLEEEILYRLWQRQDPRFLLRMHVVLLAASGIKVSRLSKIYRLNATTIQRWLHRADQYGVKGLKDRTGSGRRPSLTREEEHQVALDLKNAPRQVGFRQHSWSGRLLSRHLKTCYQVDLKERQCQNLIRRLAGTDTDIG